MITERILKREIVHWFDLEPDRTIPDETTPYGVCRRKLSMTVISSCADYVVRFNVVDVAYRHARLHDVEVYEPIETLGVYVRSVYDDTLIWHMTMALGNDSVCGPAAREFAYTLMWHLFWRHPDVRKLICAQFPTWSAHQIEACSLDEPTGITLTVAEKSGSSTSTTKMDRGYRMERIEVDTVRTCTPVSSLKGDTLRAATDGALNNLTEILEAVASHAISAADAEMLIDNLVPDPPPHCRY